MSIAEMHAWYKTNTAVRELLQPNKEEIFQIKDPKMTQI